MGPSHRRPRRIPRIWSPTRRPCARASSATPPRARPTTTWIRPRPRRRRARPGWGRSRRPPSSRSRRRRRAHGRSSRALCRSLARAARVIALREPAGRRGINKPSVPVRHTGFTSGGHARTVISWFTTRRFGSSRPRPAHLSKTRRGQNFLLCSAPAGAGRLRSSLSHMRAALQLGRSRRAASARHPRVARPHPPAPPPRAARPRVASPSRPRPLRLSDRRHVVDPRAPRADGEPSLRPRPDRGSLRARHRRLQRHRPRHRRAPRRARLPPRRRRATRRSPRGSRREAPAQTSAPPSTASPSTSPTWMPSPPSPPPSPPTSRTFPSSSTTPAARSAPPSARRTT